ncbi:DUF6708 domain-containing protein [Pseudomonas sp. 5P_5.1_Bac1]|uniref:DUF6708 domain-containing protein n=1 Tax=Pseudomonas sp. 5P_5.1_Bac1 TaxID=2971616 RepID=UPI0021C6978E|nr:DUF6708 domain-containing protein [Pseudomonas sp. 5P_5.1_Bac1]MCU1720350.1 hypothetical protein [Pseudomonas sp. 5P_5.1_Bac1]
MYFLERGFEWSKTLITYEEATKSALNQKRQPGQEELNAPDGVGESVSDLAYDNSSLYAHNDTYIDLRTPNDEKRGIVSIFSLGIYGVIFQGLIGTLYLAAKRIFSGHRHNGELLETADYFFLVTFPIFWLLVLVIFLKYTLRFIRLESFTARRIIIRFNRITRKVYLLRPKHLGGICIMDWDKTEVIVDKNMSELDGTGGYVILGWEKGDGVDLQGTPTDNIELTFIGKPTRNASELLAFWEYIRRYMEDGPAAAPAPEKLICKFPWPWLSLKAAWGLDTSFLRQRELRIFVLLNLLLWPVILIHATGHWLSLLLCYEPRFPKSIEDAGADISDWNAR